MSIFLPPRLPFKSIYRAFSLALAIAFVPSLSHSVFRESRSPDERRRRSARSLSFFLAFSQAFCAPAFFRLLSSFICQSGLAYGHTIFLFPLLSLSPLPSRYSEVNFKHPFQECCTYTSLFFVIHSIQHLAFFLIHDPVFCNTHEFPPSVIQTPHGLLCYAY